MTQIRFTIIIIISLSFLLIVPASTQDAETTDEPIPTIILPTPTPTLTMIVPSSTPTLTITVQPTSTITPSLTPIQTISATFTSDISGTQTAATTTALTLTSTQLPDAESTEELNPLSGTETETVIAVEPPTPMMDISATSTEAVISLTPISSVMPSISPTITHITPTVSSISPTLSSVSTTLTPTVMPAISATQPMVSITPTFEPTATIGGLPLRYIQGIARYQNYVTDDSGIRVQIYDDHLTLVSDVMTNADGIYNVAVPLDGNFWIVVSAVGHRTERIYVSDADTTLEMTLLAGDLNNDECINFDDIRLIQVDSDDTQFDLNNDAVIDLSDVALLSGNLNPDCIATIEPTATIISTLEATWTSTLEATTAMTPTPTIAISATATEISITPEVPPESTEGQ